MWQFLCILTPLTQGQILPVLFQVSTQPQCSDQLHPIPSSSSSSSSSLGPCRAWQVSGVTAGSCARWLSLEAPCPRSVPGVPLQGKLPLSCGCSQPEFHVSPGATSSLTWSTAGTQQLSLRGFADFVVLLFIAPKQTAPSQDSPFGKHSCFTFQVHPNAAEAMG